VPGPTSSSTLGEDQSTTTSNASASNNVMLPSASTPPPLDTSITEDPPAVGTTRTGRLDPQVRFYPQCDAKAVPSKWFKDFAMTVEYCNNSVDSAFLTDISSNLNFNNSITFEEAMKHPGWRASMTDKIESILKNKVYTLVDPPPGVEPIDLKWVFKVKDGVAKEHPRLKSRLVVRGFVQEEGKDFWETFAPTVKWTQFVLYLCLLPLLVGLYTI
jgi:hypothetical protein